MQSLVFREAKISDIPLIVEIHNENARSETVSGERGFLLAPVTADKIEEALNKSTRYFVTENESQDILGFVGIVSQPKASPELWANIDWKDNEFQNKVEESRHFYIQVVATQRNFQSQGIGRFLYESLYREFPESLLSAFIVTKPILNACSVRFHVRQGFQEAGIFKAAQFLDMKNYEATLMYRLT